MTIFCRVTSVSEPHPSHALGTAREGHERPQEKLAAERYRREAHHGIIFDIQRFAIHDGPGIRTTVFFKGCPLSCWWCHNPESLRLEPQLVLFEHKCIGCGKCLTVCERRVHERLPDGTRVFHRDRCAVCGACVESCYAGALVIQGRRMSAEEVTAELRKDAPFYANSGGGITLSGGEPMYQYRFAKAVLTLAKGEGFHTALDTSGYAPWHAYDEVLPFVDLVLYDFKIADSAAHEKYTGVPNALITENLRQIAAMGMAIEVRIPVITGVNDSDENVVAMGDTLAAIPGVKRVKLLPYHRLGEGKYQRLGYEYRLRDVSPPSRERMCAIAELLSTRHLEVIVG